MGINNITLSEIIDPVELQQEHAEPIISSAELQISEETQQFHQDLLEDAEKFPILKSNDETEALCRLLRGMEGYLLKFREQLEYLTLKTAIQDWLTKLNIATRKKYTPLITDMLNKKIIPESYADGKEFTIGGFRWIRHEAVIDYIKKTENLTEIEKQERIACYASLIDYLNKISYEWFRKPSMLTTENNLPYRMTPNAVNQTLSFSDWRLFIDVLYELNHRDSIIARCILQGVKRISEILNLTIDRIDFQNNIIRFSQKKTNGGTQEIPISYNADFMQELKEYIESSAQKRKSSCFVFITSNGKPVTRSRLNYSFAQASLQAKIKRVTPEALRANWTIFIKQGYKDLGIMQNKKRRQNYDF